MCVQAGLTVACCCAAMRRLWNDAMRLKTSNNGTMTETMTKTTMTEQRQRQQ